MITELKDNEIFIFGSNLAGIHAAGAALVAKEMFGAHEGIGEGLTGKCYAFPTLNPDFTQRDKEGLMTSVDKLYVVARANLDKQFLLTKVGTGIAGFSDYYMQSLFKNPPANIVLPEGWKVNSQNTNG